MAHSKKATMKKTAAPASASTPPSKKHKPSVEKKRDTMWFDSDDPCIECPICFDPFDAAIFTCANGHSACGGCCLRFNRKCGTCAQPIADVRCRLMEDHLAVVERHCKFREYGCEETVKHTKARAHEESCPFAVYDCPFNGCDCQEQGSLLLKHVEDDHADEVARISNLRSTKVTVSMAAPFRVLVQPGRLRVYLLVGGDVLGGRCLTLVCLGPKPESGDEIEFTMEVRGHEADALTLTATAPCVRSLEGFEAKDVLFVPDSEWESSGSLSLDVRVG